MAEIIETNYELIEPLKDKTTETLIGEINQIYSQLEIIGNMGCKLIAEAGNRLIVIKNRIGHGNWGKWIEENLNFSQRKANYMMNFAEKISEENNIFSNSQMFANLNISTFYKVLAAPEEIQEELVSNPDLPDMTNKKLDEEIKRLKEENQTIPGLNNKIFNLENNINELQETINKLEEKLEEVNEKQNEEEKKNFEDTISKLKEQITKKEEDVLKAKEKIEKLEAAEKEKTEKAVQEAIQDILNEAEENTKKRIEEVKAEQLSEIDELKRENEKLKKQSNPRLATFKVKTNILQENFNECMKSIDEIENEETVSKLKAALKSVLKALEERI